MAPATVGPRRPWPERLRVRAENVPPSERKPPAIEMPAAPLAARSSVEFGASTRSAPASSAIEPSAVKVTLPAPLSAIVCAAMRPDGAAAAAAGVLANSAVPRRDREVADARADEGPVAEGVAAVAAKADVQARRRRHRVGAAGFARAGRGACADVAVEQGVRRGDRERAAGLPVDVAPFEPPRARLRGHELRHDSPAIERGRTGCAFDGGVDDVPGRLAEGVALAVCADEASRRDHRIAVVDLAARDVQGRPRVGGQRPGRGQRDAATLRQPLLGGALDRGGVGTGVAQDRRPLANIRRSTLLR